MRRSAGRKRLFGVIDAKIPQPIMISACIELAQRTRDGLGIRLWLTLGGARSGWVNQPQAHWSEGRDPQRRMTRRTDHDAAAMQDPRKSLFGTTDGTGNHGYASIGAHTVRFGTSSIHGSRHSPVCGL